MEYLLYKLKRSAHGVETSSTPQIPGKIAEFSLFSLRWFFPVVRAGGIEYIKAIIMALWWVLAGVAKIGDFRVYAYVASGGSVLHYSVISPTTMHMPWLARNDAGTEIGGCLTVPVARGKKIYPYVLRQIAHTVEHAQPLYMIVEDSNTASQGGMKRAGFEMAHKLRRKSGSGRPPQYEIRSGD